MRLVDSLFEKAKTAIPPGLEDWEDRVDAWCGEYSSKWSEAVLTEINLDFAVFLFDHASERVTLAYAVSVEQLHPRDAARMRGFPNVNASIRKVLGHRAFPADRGHYLGHASGGALDINLFPQRRDLNRGWSQEGKRFRKMERHVADHPGAFFYHRPIYEDETWIPSEMEYGVLRTPGGWWTDRFRNR